MEHVLPSGVLCSASIPSHAKCPITALRFYLHSTLKPVHDTLIGGSNAEPLNPFILLLGKWNRSSAKDLGTLFLFHKRADTVAVASDTLGNADIWACQEGARW